VLVDLHAHYPMHVTEGSPKTVRGQLGKWRKARLRARLVNLISYVFNYEGPGGAPGVTVPLMKSGKVGAALSVLYAPFTEIDPDLHYGAPPKKGYVNDITEQMRWVEESVKDCDDVVCPVTRSEQLDWAMKPESGRLALIHCIEGGHVLGATPEEIRENVSMLADRGVAYVTIAHLFWRRVATNAPALPFLPDWLYRLLFPQRESTGLTELGKVAVAEMHKKRVLVDITHMSDASITQTLDLLDTVDPRCEAPVIATHGACRFPKRPRFRQLTYNLSDETITRIAGRGGVIGLIACKHYISRGVKLPLYVRDFDDTMKLLCKHIDRIQGLTGSFDHVAIGTDLDGFIKPALPGLKDMSRLDDLQNALRGRYGSDAADRICSRNALRVLRYRFA
jgi:microsomal dipeptidase-like Zn-dependent dipeptidase